ncbi:MAG: protein translocase subunit SecD [Thermoleophilia bacterium]
MTEKKKNIIILLIMLALVVASVFVVYPPAEKTKLGLDLQGGLEIILEAQGPVTSDQMDRALLVVRNRVDKLGVAEPSITRQGDNQIAVALAGVSDPDEAESLIGKTALLEFKQVDSALTGQALGGTLTQEQLPEGKQLLYETQLDEEGNPQRDEAGQPVRTAYVVNTEPLMTGDVIEDASIGSDQFGKRNVQMDFTGEGGDIFARVTEQLAAEGQIMGVPQRMAIVLDDEIQSAPSVQEKITGGSAVINYSGQINFKELENTVLVLQTGALPVELTTIDKVEISATLGKDSLRQGLMAGAVGLALVMVFMIVYYRLLGVVAVLALGIYGILFYAALSNPWYPATLTLPGIAGMILTVGVAADANVVIFERIKEEVRAGKTVRSAVSAGYSKGFHTILDANAVTLITAVVIYAVATAGVKGFALTLIIGVLISMFTAILATRAMLGLLSNLRLFNNPILMGLKLERGAGREAGR